MSNAMSHEHIQRVKEQLKGIYNSTDNDVLSVSYGHKKTGNEYTGEKAIRFGLIKKKPINEIPSDKVIPKQITVDGVEYKTDVFELKKASVFLEKIDNSETQSSEAGINALDSSNCTNWRLVTTTPGARISNLTVHGLCGARSASADFIDQTEFCLDNGIVPSAGTGYSWTMLTSCYYVYTCNTQYGNPLAAPIGTHRTKIRPLVGGVSMINRQKTGDTYAATLGGILTDSLDGKMVGITNSHVSGTPSYLNNGSHLAYFLASEVSGGNYIHYNNIENTQPSVGDTVSGLFIEADKIGTTKRIFPMMEEEYNYLDCAIINLTSSIVSTDSWKQLSLDLSSPAIFATTEEIDAITPSTPVMAAGRTSGPRGTYVTQSSYFTGYYAPTGTTYNYSNKQSGTCCFSISDPSSTVIVSGYGNTGQNGELIFTDQIMMEADYPCNVPPSLGGDSGSLLFAYIGDTWKIVGLIFAGNGGTVGFANRIDRIKNLMKVAPYTGSAVNANPNTPTYQTLDYVTYAGQVSASIGGKTYWQVGKA